jgi:hypothetical protein
MLYGAFQPLYNALVFQLSTNWRYDEAVACISPFAQYVYSLTTLSKQPCLILLESLQPANLLQDRRAGKPLQTK